MLERELSALLNRHSAENESDTPDFILAEFLLGCLEAYNRSMQERKIFYRSYGEPIEESVAG